jgi:hypothetical protein
MGVVGWMVGYEVGCWSGCSPVVLFVFPLPFRPIIQKKTAGRSHLSFASLSAMAPKVLRPPHAVTTVVAASLGKGKGKGKCPGKGKDAGKFMGKGQSKDKGKGRIARAMAAAAAAPMAAVAALDFGWQLTVHREGFPEINRLRIVVWGHHNIRDLSRTISHWWGPGEWYLSTSDGVNLLDWGRSLQSYGINAETILEAVEAEESPEDPTTTEPEPSPMS